MRNDIPPTRLIATISLRLILAIICAAFMFAWMFEKYEMQRYPNLTVSLGSERTELLNVAIMHIILGIGPAAVALAIEVIWGRSFLVSSIAAISSNVLGAGVLWVLSYIGGFGVGLSSWIAIVQGGLGIVAFLLVLLPQRRRPKS